MSAVIAIITIIGNDWLKTAREGRESQIKCLEQKITEFVILCVHLGQRLDFTDEETEIQGGNIVVNGESFPFLLGHHRAFSRVPCAIQSVLISYLFYTQ